MTSNLRSQLLAAALALSACGAQAAVTTINSSLEGGFYNPNGFSVHSGPGAGIVGIHEAPAPGGLCCTVWNRAYLVFDLDSLGSITDPITAATLRIKITSFESTGPGTLKNGKWSTTGRDSETFAVFGVATSVDRLTDDYGSLGAPFGDINPIGLAIWSNLAGGSPWGSFTASDDVVGDFVNVQLNEAALAALNKAKNQSSTIAFGLNFTGSFLSRLGGENGAPLVVQQITIDTRDNGHRLRLTTNPIPAVPEPGAGWLALAGGALVLLARRRTGNA